MDPILNSLNQHYKNYMVDCKENQIFYLGVKGSSVTKVNALSNNKFYSSINFYYFQDLIIIY